MNPKIIAVDFDGTLCAEKWPLIGEPNYELFKYLHEQKRLGAKLILNTCRTDELLADAVEWCVDHGLIFDAVNENLPEIIEKYGRGDTRKISADEYIDDRMCTKFKFPFVPEKPTTRNEIRALYGLPPVAPGLCQCCIYYRKISDWEYSETHECRILRRNLGPEGYCSLFDKVGRDNDDFN